MPHPFLQTSTDCMPSLLFVQKLHRHRQSFLGTNGQRKNEVRRSAKARAWTNVSSASIFLLPILDLDIACFLSFAWHLWLYPPHPQGEAKIMHKKVQASHLESSGPHSCRTYEFKNKQCIVQIRSRHMRRIWRSGVRWHWSFPPGSSLFLFQDLLH